MSWSRKFDNCQKCGRDDRPHMAHGLCTPCYEAFRYALNAEKERARRKLVRLANNTIAKRYPKTRAWVEANRERNAAVKASWHKAHNPGKWPLGAEVWFWYKGFWRRATITAKKGKSPIVTVPGLVEQLVGSKRTYLLSREMPAYLDCGPEKPKKVLRKTGWSMKYDRCQDCQTTWNPYCCSGLCTICYERARSARRREAKKLKLHVAEQERRMA